MQQALADLAQALALKTTADVTTVDGGNMLLVGSTGRMPDVGRGNIKSGVLILSNGVGTTVGDRLDHDVSLQGGEFKIVGPADSAAVDEVISGVLSLERGRSVITLDLSVPITAGSGSESIVLPALPSAVQRVSLSLRAPVLALSVSGGLIVERSSSGQATRFLICGQPDMPLGLTWSRRRENVGASQPIFVVHGITGTHYSMLQMASINRSTTYISLNSGSCTVMCGSSPSLKEKSISMSMR